MKKLHLTPSQAICLADDLQEYAKLEDSSIRPLFEGFIIKFSDLAANSLCRNDEALIQMHPIPSHTDIDGEHDFEFPPQAIQQ